MSNGGTCPRMRSSGNSRGVRRQLTDRNSCAISTGFQNDVREAILDCTAGPVAVDPYCRPPERAFLTEVTSNPTEPLNDSCMVGTSNRPCGPGGFDPIVRRGRIIVDFAWLLPIGTRRHVANSLHDVSVSVPDWELVFRHVLAESNDRGLEPRVILRPNVEIARRRRHHHALQHGHDLPGFRPSAQ